MTGRAAIVGLTGLTFGVGVAARFFRDRRRFGSFSFKNQTRSVSSEIPTWRFASDRAINRIDAPARRPVSNTSRYGSSAVKRWERGWRPAATNCASLRAFSVVASAMSSGGGTVESRASVCCSAAYAGASVVFMLVKNRATRGRAMGAPRSGSKPNGLDVGVLLHGFCWNSRENSRHQSRMLETGHWDCLLKRILGLVLRRRCHGEVDAYAVSSVRVISRSVFHPQ
jgi:hypothetical protein